MKLVLVWLPGLALCGCNLIDTKGLALEYSFDPEQFSSPQFGNPKSASAVMPASHCQRGASLDSCMFAPAPTSTKFTTYGGEQCSCVAVVDVRGGTTIDFSMQSSFPM